MKKQKNSILADNLNWTDTPEFLINFAPMNEIDVLELKKKIENNDSFTLLDVRDAHELYISNLDIESTHIPFDDLSSRISELDDSTPIIVMCRSGNSSSKAYELLQESGFKNIFNLKGGINEWARNIDTTLPVY